MRVPALHDAELIFDELVELTASKREVLLAERCGDDDELRVFVAQLLANHDRGLGGFLDPPVTRPPDELEQTSARIGPYRMLERIGEGGFGEVYLAQQVEPVRRKVALKIVKLGMDTREVVARFEAERQALAMMDHPNIARVLEAGATEHGRPYFVMEYVPGLPITEYCDRKRLDMAERLEVFVQACDAIQHAHQKGIIHRDVKPSNILVAPLGDRHHPKVIDFGIAKAMGPRLTQRTLLTEQGQLVGTPEYMSPEQAESTGEALDTRTDIYSLGVLLYELLVGALPFDPQMFHGKGLSEILRIIREVNPPKPSTRLTTVGMRPEAIAQRRGTDLRALRRRLRGDLDWIIMKAMEKERERRYASVSELAADIERHLRHEPVIAGRPSTVYRLRKVFRRHRGPLTIVTASFLAVAGAAVGLAILYGQASVERAAAEDARLDAERKLVDLRGLLYGPRSQPSFVDDFEDGVLDADLTIVQPPCAAVEENEGRLRLTLPPACVGLAVVELDSKRTVLRGDFEVSVGFRLERFSEPSDRGAYRVAGLHVRGLDGSGFATVERLTYPSHSQYSAWTTDPRHAQGARVSTATTDAEGMLRIARIGSTFRMYYWAGDWILLKEQAVTDREAVLRLFTDARGDRAGHVVAFDDLTVRTTFGSVVSCLDDLVETFEGETIDTRFVTEGRCGLPVEQGGRIVIQKLDGCVGTASCILDGSRFAICGDFDLSVDFEIDELPVTPHGAHYATLNVRTLEGVPVATISRYNQGIVDSCVPAQRAYKAHTTSSENCDSTIVAGDHDRGRLRIRRTGSRISLFFWDGGWHELRSETCTTANVLPELIVGTHASGAGSKVAFDNLRLGNASDDAPLHDG